jgi:hypothetical protein
MGVPHTRAGRRGALFSHLCSEFIQRTDKDMDGAEISKLITGVSWDPSDSMPLAGFRLNRLDPFREFLFVNVPRDLHLRKAIEDFSFCHRPQSINHLDELGPEVLEKFRPLIHTAHRTIVSPRRPVERAEAGWGKCVIAFSRADESYSVGRSPGEVVS